MNLLIVGGAGYLGSHISLEALKKNLKVSIFDDLSTGSLGNISSKADFIQGSTLSKKNLKDLFSVNSFDAVVHLAASKSASESMEKPFLYSNNNIIGGLNLIEACVENKVKFFLFSSTAAVYGLPKYLPIDESHPLGPINYYGYSKLVIENNLKWISKIKNFKYASLRYFNAAGFDRANRVLNTEKNPQNLIPKVMEVALGIEDQIEVFGDDYETKDGTGIRDYVHVSDLASAHIKALNYLMKTKQDLIINLGTGNGHSVYDVISTAEKITGERIKILKKGRRAGDPDSVISSGVLAEKILKWIPKYSDLETILSSTWNIYKNFKLI